MNRKIWIAVAVFGVGFPAMADFPDDFQHAMQLRAVGKNEEACQRFTALAQAAPTSGSKSDALRYAVSCAIGAKRFDEAKNLLTQIPRPSTKKLCEMELLLAIGKPKELIDRFKDEDLGEWSDFHIFDACVARANAYRRLARYAEALKDHRMAQEVAMNTERQSQILNLLGGTLQQTGDDDAALAVWRQMEALPNMKGRGIVNDATISAARILAKRQQYDEALKEMAKIEAPATGYWHARPLIVEGEIYAAQGKKAEAMAKYNQALNGAPEDMRKSIQAAIEKMK